MMFVSGNHLDAGEYPAWLVEYITGEPMQRSITSCKDIGKIRWPSEQCFDWSNVSFVNRAFQCCKLMNEQMWCRMGSI
jgi:hypothetical protein